MLALLGLTAACNTVGPAALAGARFDYNQEIARSWEQQLLLNLVRLRYRDTPLFLDVSSVVAQYSLRTGAAVSPVLNVDGGSHTETATGLNLAYEERPTITLVPLQGDDFTRRLLTPIPPETLLLLSQSGWSVSRLLMCGVQRLHTLQNMPRAGGPTPTEIEVDPRFDELVSLLRDLQVTGGLDLTPVAAGGGVSIRLRLGEPDDPDEQARLDRLRGLLAMADDARELSLVRQPTGPDEVLVEARSLMGVLFFLSHAVEAPAEHIAEGLVTRSHTPDGAPIDWVRATGGLLRVRSSADVPDRAFAAVSYRDHWFWIDDRDLESKSTFFLLHYLFSLQASSGAGLAPTLTVSAGG
ncbi:MAG: hypothetical protein AB7O97_17245 [Planctomycetota bacterium]